MKASPEQQVLLLQVQNLDTLLGQLEHRKKTLSQTAQLVEVIDELASLNTRIVQAQTELTDLNRELTKAEGEVASVRSRAKRDQELIDSGSITSSKQLEDLTHEVESLAKRQRDLEDAELEVMEQAEDVTNRVNALTADVEANEARRAQLAAEQEVAHGEIDAEVADAQQQRATHVGQIDGELVSLYEKIRSSTGIGAAKLSYGRCEGCHMQLAPTEQNAIEAAADDDVVRCEECRCILIRTS